MFDIVSIIREKIFRRPKLNTHVAGEELSEKQTTKLGYFLLFCMFSVILTSAQWTLSIIENIPSKPSIVPYCVGNMINSFNDNNVSYNSNYYYENGYNECQLTSYNPEFDFTDEYNYLLVSFNDIENYRDSIRDLDEEKRQTKSDQENTRDEYNISLTEKIAQEKSGLYDSKNIKSEIENSRVQLQKIESKIIDNNNKINKIISNNKNEIDNLIKSYDKANIDYRTSYLLYRFYVALLSLLFSVIVFSILYKFYIRQKIKNSPHTIIFSVATFAYGLILLQISALFIWDIIPHKLLELITKFISAFKPLIFLIQFLWPIFIIAIFGLLVFKIQKRLYSPQNILKRFISDKKCPKCGNNVDFTKPFCPLCSNEIQSHCPHCHEFSLKGMPYCSNCGKTI